MGANRSRVGARRDSIDSQGSDMQTGTCISDPITAEGRRSQTIQTILITITPFFILILQTSLAIHSSLENTQNVEEADRISTSHDGIFRMVAALSEEQRVIFWRNVTENSSLINAFTQTTESIYALDPWPLAVSYNNISFSNAESLMAVLEVERAYALTGQDKPGYESIWFYGGLIQAFINSIIEDNNNLPSEAIWKASEAHAYCLEAEDMYKTEQMIGFWELDKNAGRVMEGTMLELFVDSRAFGDYMLAACLFNTPEHRQVASSELEERSGMMDELRTTLIYDLDNADLASLTLSWVTNSTLFLETIATIRVNAEEYVNTARDKVVRSNSSDFAVSVFIVILVLAISPAILFVVLRMTRRMQRYAQHLSAKNMQLRRDKTKSDSLLYQMLPKSVALQLKMNKKVSAENYNAVTIFFSDIVGFTSLSAKSSPMEVVAFLNRLYHLFDTAIERYDVYKVETIGDAYMVASGCPQRNGSRHAGEISSLSMDILEGIKVFKIPHLPNERLKIRIGLHTGPVVAGVVGSKMPRYCLFGETVTIAAKMESGGTAMKIHISEQCKMKLDTLGGYMSEPAGSVDIVMKRLQSETIPMKDTSYIPRGGICMESSRGLWPREISIQISLSGIYLHLSQVSNRNDPSGTSSIKITTYFLRGKISTAGRGSGTSHK